MASESDNTAVNRILQSLQTSKFGVSTLSTTPIHYDWCDSCQKIDMVSFMHERYKHLDGDTRVLCWRCYSCENMNKQYELFKALGLIKE